MKGSQAWDCGQFHGKCPDVRVVDIGGFRYLWCANCRVLANLDGVSPKIANLTDCCVERSAVEGGFYPKGDES
jgi:hypothetical protein